MTSRQSYVCGRSGAIPRNYDIYIYIYIHIQLTSTTINTAYPESVPQHRQASVRVWTSDSFYADRWRLHIWRLAVICEKSVALKSVRSPYHQGNPHIREYRIFAPVRPRMQAAGLECLNLQIAAAFPDPQTRAFPGTEFTQKTRSRKYGRVPHNVLSQGTVLGGATRHRVVIPVLIPQCSCTILITLLGVIMLNHWKSGHQSMVVISDLAGCIRNTQACHQQ